MEQVCADDAGIAQGNRAGKYAVMLILAGAGAAAGMVIGLIGGMIAGEFATAAEAMQTLLPMGIVSVSLTMIVGGLMIPLLLRFGAERGRLLLLAAILIPAAIVYGIYLLMTSIGIALTEALLQSIILFSPIAALVWDAGMLQISHRVFAKTEV